MKSLPIVLGALLFLAAIPSSSAQTTSFSYQGKLTDSGSPANGNYDLQFKLFDTPTVGAGTQQGTTIANPTVAVSSGIFTVTLDFGANVFSGAARYLEIGVRPAGSPNAYAVLAPRQSIASAPYAIQTINAVTANALSSACSACVQDAQINSVAGSKVSGLIPVNSVPAGSSNYIQNTSSPQSNASFNISGNGALGSLNANGALSLAGISPPAVPASGQGRIYFDSSSNKLKVSESGGAFINLVGASGVVGSGTTNSIPLWTAGTTLGNSLLAQSGANVGIGTTTPQSTLDVRGSLTLEAGSSPGLFTGTGNVELNRYLALLNSPTSASASGLKAGGILVSNDYFFANPGKNDLIVKGSVGIGTASPTGGRLHVSGSGNGVYGASTGSGAIGVFGESTLFEGVRGVSHGATSGGVVGYNVSTGIGVYGQSDNGIGMQGRSVSGAGVDGGSTNGVGVYGASTNSYAMYANGNVGQPVGAGGFVKAMVLVNPDTTINLCYNSQLTGSAATTPPCGLSVIQGPHAKAYDITFNFQVNVRFLSATTAYECCGTTLYNGAPEVIGARPISFQTIRVQTANLGVAFYLIVF